MEKEYGAQYSDLYHRHWWWRARERYLTAVIEREATPAGFGAILDIGCGDGLYFPVLQRFGEPYGIEPETALLSRDGPYRDRIFAGPLDDRYQPPRKFGLALALDVLEHIEDPQPIVERVRELLVPGGLFVVTVPAFMPLWTAHDVLNHHFTRYTRDRLEQIVRAAEFTSISSRYFMVWLAGAKWGVARAEKIVPRAARPPQVPPAPLNFLLETLCAVEQGIVGARRPPFGSSLLLTARSPA